MSVRATNRHPVDQLALVRETIKNLKEHEDALKDEVGRLMGGADSLGGDEFIARQSIIERKGAIDDAALKKAGVDVERYRKPKTVIHTIRVEKRVFDEVE